MYELNSNINTWSFHQFDVLLKPAPHISFYNVNIYTMCQYPSGLKRKCIVWRKRRKTQGCSIIWGTQSLKKKYVNFPKWQDASFVFSSLLNHSVIPLKSGEAKRINKQKASLWNPSNAVSRTFWGWVEVFEGMWGDEWGGKKIIPLRSVPQGVSIANRSNMGLRSFF